MKQDNGYKIIAIVALIVAVLGLTVVYTSYIQFIIRTIILLLMH